MTKDASHPLTTALVLAGLFLLVASPTLAEETGTPPSAPCSGPEHRQFDFWVGDWDVTKPDGTPAGTNRIEIILGGCVLQESWSSADGAHAGHSFNLYGRDGRWHQTWVDNGGLLLALVGGPEDGRMVMSQDVTRPDGKRARRGDGSRSISPRSPPQIPRPNLGGVGLWNDCEDPLDTAAFRAYCIYRLDTV